MQMLRGGRQQRGPRPPSPPWRCQGILWHAATLLILPLCCWLLGMLALGEGGRCGGLLGEMLGFDDAAVQLAKDLDLPGRV